MRHHMDRGDALGLEEDLSEPWPIEPGRFMIGIESYNLALPVAGDDAPDL